MNASQIYDDLQHAIDLLCPPLYYALDKNIELGHIIYAKETDLCPEFIVIHFDDFETVKQKITGRRLVHLKDEPREKVLERITRRLQYKPVYFNPYFHKEGDA